MPRGLLLFAYALLLLALAAQLKRQPHQAATRQVFEQTALGGATAAASDPQPSPTKAPIALPCEGAPPPVRLAEPVEDVDAELDEPPEDPLAAAPAPQIPAPGEEREQTPDRGPPAAQDLSDTEETWLEEVARRASTPSSLIGFARSYRDLPRPEEPAFAPEEPPVEEAPVATPSPTFGPDNHGVSALGLCSPHFDCTSFISAFEEASVIRTGWIDNSFSDSCSCGIRLLHHHAPKIVRIHIANSPCLRNQRCGVYEIFYGEDPLSADQKIKSREQQLLSRFRRRWAVVKSQIAGAVNARLLISNCLECDLSEESRAVLIEEARAFFPDLEFVDNPMPYSGPCLPRTICEYHSSPPPQSGPYIVDLDGTDFYSIDPVRLSQEHSAALMVLMWTPSFNGAPAGQPFIDPRERVSFPSRLDFDAVRAWVRAAPQPNQSGPP